MPKLATVVVMVLGVGRIKVDFVAGFVVNTVQQMHKFLNQTYFVYIF